MPRIRMNQPLSFLNWSLTKALDTEPDSFVKARIRIIFTILSFAILKVLIVVSLSLVNEQSLQVLRAIIAFVFYLTLIKVLLFRPGWLKQLSHIMLVMGTVLVWTNIFVFAHKINLPTLQFLFMIILGAFYTLGSGWGIFYSVACIVPVLLFLVLHGNLSIYATNAPQEFASPGFEIIVILNFLSIVVSHYLFYKAFDVNIKEKEKLNKELQLSIAEANKLATSKSNFLSTMSHELRTPLNSVVGITELLLADNPEERHKENLKILHASTLDLLSLINNVLDFNKIDSDKLVLEAVPVHLVEFMKNICSGQRIKANDKDLELILNFDNRLEQTTIISDPTRLAQLIYNLVGNAIKFTEKGCITVEVECQNRRPDSIDVLFSVTDTGIGIDPDKRDTIFELFTQAESHITRKYGGTGLGLAIVKQILLLFGSDIELESSPGKGTHFFFTILFTLAEEIKKVETLPDTSKRDFSHLKILVAEDNELNRLVIKKQFDTLNITPVIVENGKLAYETLISTPFDAIFMDLHMPVLDGYETTRQIRELADPAKAKVYIIAFTASVTEQQQISDTGFDDYLYKPVNMKELTARLEKIEQLNNKVGCSSLL